MSRLVDVDGQPVGKSSAVDIRPGMVPLSANCLPTPDRRTIVILFKSSNPIPLESTINALRTFADKLEGDLRKAEAEEQKKLETLTPESSPI